MLAHYAIVNKLWVTNHVYTFQIEDKLLVQFFFALSNESQARRLERVVNARQQ